MKEFSRRAFLKGILTLAVSAAVPVELIEKAALAIDSLPDIPIDKIPTGYFKINDLLVPITWMEISCPMGDFIRYGYLSSLELPEITFITNFRLPPYRNEQVVFSISDKHLPFELTGNGYFSSRSVNSILINSNEPTEYTYCMVCKIDQYKQEVQNCDL